VEFAGDEAALLLRTDDEEVLVVSDLHLGYELELAREGVYFPSQLSNILERLARLLDRRSVDTLVLLGDVKHRVAGVSWRESRQVTELLQSLRRYVRRIVITPGNHDAGIMSLAGGLAEVVSGRGIGLGDAWMLHGHCWPPPQAARSQLIVIGHTHPVISFARGPGSRRKVFLIAEAPRWRVLKTFSDKFAGERVRRVKGHVTLLVLPHFNNALQGVEVSQLLLGGRALSPLIRGGAFDMRRASILMLDGSRLGGLEWYVKAAELW